MGNEFNTICTDTPLPFVIKNFFLNLIVLKSILQIISE